MAVVASAEAGLRAAALGATIVQLRSTEPVSRLEAEAVRLAGTSPVPVLVSSRVDVALAAGAAGVNLPERDIPPAAARRLLGPDRLVGRSIHAREAAAEAAAEGADYVIFGPVFETPSHPGGPGLGLELLAEVAAAVKIPVLAIGGVDSGRVTACLAAGAAGFAAIRAFA